MEKVLVVDDEIEACRAMYDFLTDKGYEVQTASDGPTAIKKLKAWKPRVVLLDMIMPGMEGSQVLSEIRKIDPGVGVVMVTVVTDNMKARKTFEIGAYDYVTKPVDFEYLEKVITAKMIEVA